MRMHLQSTLEPLLTKLWKAAEDHYIGEVVQQYPVPHTREDGPKIQAEMEHAFEQVIAPELSILDTRFRGYVKLDDFDLDPIAELFADPSDKWQTPTGDSVFCQVARASQDVDDVAKLVHSDLFRNKLATDEPGKWTGVAAMTFRDNFLDPYQKTTAPVQGSCAVQMATAAKALADAVERAKECVVWICKSTIFQLHGGEYPGPLPGEEPERGARKAAGLVAILADAVGTFKALTEGPLGVLLAGIGLVGGLVAESKSPSAEDAIRFSPGGAGLTQDIITGAEGALSALDGNIAELDGMISRGLDADSAMFDTARLVLRTGGHVGEHSGPGWEDPQLAPSAYQHLTGSGDDSPWDTTITDYVRLYYAGHVTLPQAGAKLDTGVKVCDQAFVTGRLGDLFPRAIPQFNNAVRVFATALTATRDDCTRYGEAMETAAKSYESADAYEGRRIRSLEAQIPAPDDPVGWQHYTRPEELKP